MPTSSPNLKGHRQMTKTEEETMTKQIEDSHGESNKEEVLKHLNKEETMKWLEKEYDEYIRTIGHCYACDWVEILLTVILMVITVGGFTFSIVNVIRMLVEHKFAYWTAAFNIFWAIVFLSQWVYHLAQTLMQKFR